MMRTAAVALVVLMTPAFVLGQRAVGELRLFVTDETGLPVRASGVLDSQGADVRRPFTTDDLGSFVATALPFGVYHLQVSRPGFAGASASIDVRSEVPITERVTLRVAPLLASVSVTPVPPTIVDPFLTGSTAILGVDRLADRPASAPGRSIADLVNTQPGWLLEANGVLHPRGSEYQVQYVVDGIPFRDNRSAAFAQSLGVDEFESLTVRTGGFPAEFGGKLGGVIEVNTVRDPRTGFHGNASLQAGSFSTVNGFFFGQYGAPRVSAGVSVEAGRTDRYLDPPVEANYSNDANARGIALHFDREWSDVDRTRAYAVHRSSRFSVPNELFQQEAGQRQSRTSDETLAQVTHQHVFSAEVLGNIRFMARDAGATLTANTLSTPIRPFQDRGLNEIYVNADVAVHQRRHDLKFGAEATFGRVNESFDATITAYRLDGVRIFDRDLPAAFTFSDRRADREQALFAQDVVRFGAATLSAGIRYDHYRLVEDESAVSPRLAVSWYAPRADLVLHASYDRAFQTPAVENILLASADVVGKLGGGQSLRLVSSRGHFAEAGVSKAIADRVRATGTYYYRTADDFADDDLLLNTAVSFPIAFSKATVRGYELALDAPHWGPAAASIAYSHMAGVGHLPISGGLFLGDDVTALLNSAETFPITQDQRHTIRGRIRYRPAPRIWIAAGAQYNSGLPIELQNAPSVEFLARQYGQDVVDRVDFDAERLRSSSSIDAAAGWEVFSRDRTSIRLQADVFNIANRLNVINFAGLLSGTAIGPHRTWAVRTQIAF